MKLKALYNALFGATPDTMRLWFQCHACGHQDVMKQPCSVDSCSKCKKRHYTAEMGNTPPDWFKRKEQ